LDNNLFGILWGYGRRADTGELHYQSWSEVLSTYNIPLDRRTFQGVFGMKNEAAIARLAGRPLRPEVVAEIDERKELVFRRNVRGHLHLLPGVCFWLARFQAWEYPQVVASSAPQENIDVMLEEAGVKDYFTAVVSADGLPSKPDPAIYLEAASRIGIPAGRCIVMEDAVWGVSGAKRAGMMCIAVTTSYPAEDLQAADLIIDRLDQLTPEGFQCLTAPKGAGEVEA
jgi:beta-phosphoglucomutase-like phosphatase (HAD superfamily)